MKKRPVPKRRGYILIALEICFLLLPGIQNTCCAAEKMQQNLYVWTAEEEDQEKNTQDYTSEEKTKPEFQTDLAEGLLGEMELEEVQDWVDEMLPGEGLRVKEMILNLWNGGEIFQKEKLLLFIREILFSRIEKEKQMFSRILLLILVAAVFHNLSQILENSQLGEISFYVVYLVLFLVVTTTFSNLVKEIFHRIQEIIRWMQGLAPSYFLAVAAAGGAGQATMFYQMVLILVWILQWILGNFLIPGVQIYVLLTLVNHLSREEMLTSFSELIQNLIKWSLKTLIGFITGLQLLKGLIAPVMDTLKRSIAGRCAGAIPGVGTAVNAVTEIVLTSAVLVRNCMGVTFLFLLGMWGLEPMLHYGILSLFYKLTAAISEPVSDKRLVGALNTMGEGIALLLRIFFTVQLLCMVTIVILAVSLN